MSDLIAFSAMTGIRSGYLVRMRLDSAFRFSTECCCLNGWLGTTMEVEITGTGAGVEPTAEGFTVRDDMIGLVGFFFLCPPRRRMQALFMNECGQKNFVTVAKCLTDLKKNTFNEKKN